MQDILLNNGHRNSSTSNHMVQMRKSLAVLNNVLNLRSELPAFLAWPISRVSKYTLLIECLVKVSSADTYQHCSELKSAVAALRRVTDRLSDAQCKVEKEQRVVILRMRMSDCRGYQLDTFGMLLLDEVFVVSRADLKREYYVFLFEEVTLFCIDVPGVPPPAHRTVTPRRTTPLRLKPIFF
ncbi:hypothetical protein B0H19DRAFT_1291882 [Mycena capillaripes]|nr:hypothetical protein B0H19DRAFT_1291882 [Mycena capillaripes]